MLGHLNLIYAVCSIIFELAWTNIFLSFADEKIVFFFVFFYSCVNQPTTKRSIHVLVSCKIILNFVVCSFCA